MSSWWSVAILPVKHNGCDAGLRENYIPSPKLLVGLQTPPFPRWVKNHHALHRRSVSWDFSERKVGWDETNVPPERALKDQSLFFNDNWTFLPWGTKISEHHLNCTTGVQEAGWYWSVPSDQREIKHHWWTRQSVLCGHLSVCHICSITCHFVHFSVLHFSPNTWKELPHPGSGVGIAPLRPWGFISVPQLDLSIRRPGWCWTAAGSL